MGCLELTFIFKSTIMSADHNFVAHSAELRQVQLPSQDAAWKKLMGWTVGQLREWLGLRGVRSGEANKADLVRIAYFTWKLAVPVNQDEVTTQKEASKRLQSLLTVGNKVLPKPCDVTDWEADLQKLPTITYADIYNYLINTIGMSQEKLKAYKSLDSYNYAINGWVEELFIYQADDDFTFIKAKVKPSQHTTAPYDAWVLVRRAGTIEAARCSCTAGLGEVCSHVGAVLFKSMGAADLGLNLPDACTSIACEWNKAFCKKVIAEVIRKIDFRKPRVNKPRKRRRPARKVSRSSSSSSDGELWDILKEAGHCGASHLLNPPPSCNVFYDLGDFESEVAIEDTQPLPTFPLSIAQLLEQSMSNNLFDVVRMSVSPEQSDLIMESTKSQYLNPNWFKVRRNRITASKMGDVYSFMTSNRTTPSATVMNKITGPPRDLSDVPQIKWGNEHEQDAIDRYSKQNVCADLLVHKCGIKIPPGDAHIGASPDGHVTCSCCLPRLIEVKCPYVAGQKGMTPREGLEAGLIPCLDSEGHLKMAHVYYTQVQAQMALLEVDQCDFVIWTPEGIHVDPIKFDINYWNKVKDCLDRFYVEFVIPELTKSKTSCRPVAVQDLQPPPKKQRKKKAATT